MEKQTYRWVVTDGADACLWHGRGTMEEAIAKAHQAVNYRTETTLHLHTVSAEIVIEPGGKERK